MKKIKVLQIHPDYNIRTLDISDLGEQVVQALPKERFHTTTAFLTGKPAEGDKQSVADRSVYFDFKSKQLKGLRLVALWRLYKHLKAEQYDVVICNRFKPISMLLFLARLLPIPLCIGIAHGFGEYDRLYRRFQVKRMATSRWRFIGVSPAVKAYLLSLNSGFTAKNTVAITNAIDIEQAIAIQLSKELARKKLNITASRVLIGALGRLVPIKGHSYLIEAFAQLAAEFPEADLVIIGEGRERTLLEQQIARLKITDRVHLIGHVDNALMYTKAFDIWVMPSLQEGLGLALLEGMTAGLPIVASNVPAMKPLVQGAGGELVEPKNIAQLYQALRKLLLMTEQERHALGKQALTYVRQQHDIDQFKKQYLSFIEQNLKEVLK